MNKEELRAEFRRRRQELDPREVQERSRRVRENLERLPEFSSSRFLAIYLPKHGSGEVDTYPLLDLLGRKRIAVPVVFKEQRMMRFSEILSPGELQAGVFGIPEPKPECYRWVEPEELDLVLVPGICFDLEGRRLGYGYGYYDTFLSGLRSVNPACVSVGLAYEFQVVERLPDGPNDQRVDIIVTEEFVRRVRER
ncbi:MAG: 5-formyltetrahydrofolate cyclo-ligase [Candidatus Hadarchaeales archaeon]